MYFKSTSADAAPWIPPPGSTDTGFRPGDPGYIDTPNAIPVPKLPGGNLFSDYIVPPNNFGGGSTAGIVNASTPSAPREWQTASIAAIGSVIPLVYGDYFLGAKYLDAVTYNNRSYLCILWSLGPVVGVQEVCDSNGNPLPNDVVMRHYDGTQTTPDAGFKTAYQAAKPGKTFNATLNRRCYSIIEVPNTSQVDPSNLTAKIRGMLLYDPRSGAKYWNSNPALALADFISNDLYGWGKAIDWESVKAAADYCDELVNGQKRWTINYAIQERLSTIQLVELLRIQAHVYLNKTNGVIRMMVDKPRASVYIFDNAEKGIIGVPRPIRRGVDQSPTVINVTFSDNTIKPPQDAPAFAYAPGTQEGTTRWSESNLNMPMINSYQEAQRFAVEHLLKLQLGNLELDVECRDIGLVFEAGDVVTIPYPEYPQGKPFIIVDEPAVIGLGKYKLNTVEYQPEMWSGNVSAQPTYPDTTLPDPSSPPTPENLIVDERLSIFDAVGGDTVASALFATWDRPTGWAYNVEYVIELYCNGALVERVTMPINRYQSPPVIEGETYTIRVSTKTRTFFSPWATATVVALGKYLPPSDIEAWIERLDQNGTVRLEWTAAHDIDPITYEVRRAPDTGADISDAAVVETLWLSGEVVATTNIIRATIPDQEAGLYIYMVKALDSVGNHSVNALATPLRVYIDTDARFVDYAALDVASATHATRWTVLADLRDHWTSDRGEAINYGHADLDDATGTFADLAGVPFAVPCAAGASELLTHEWDIGVPVMGAWASSAAFVNHDDGSGNMRPADFILELSVDRSAWQPYITQSNFIVAERTARYARVRINSVGAYTLSGKPLITLDPVPRVESGRLTVGATGVFTARTTGRYSGYVGDAPVDLVYTGTEDYTPSRGAIRINSNGTMQFDIYLRDNTGKRVTGVVEWTIRGV
ncbi:MAG: hypothetical protein FWC38_00630 [Proteobacteria bacterium]|nr:hypothetical protein [Pseudomonadota bacterium]MCL2306747.1 hypothetical protein [Pseudomonadota bacterium]